MLYFIDLSRISQYYNTVSSHTDLISLETAIPTPSPFLRFGQFLFNFQGAVRGVPIISQLVLVKYIYGFPDLLPSYFYGSFWRRWSREWSGILPYFFTISENDNHLPNISAAPFRTAAQIIRHAIAIQNHFSPRMPTRSSRRWCKTGIPDLPACRSLPCSFHSSLWLSFFFYLHHAGIRSA